MKPHGLDLKLEYSIEGKIKRNFLSSILGYIHLGKGRTKVVIPMRSFVAYFLKVLHSHFSKTADYSVLKTVLSSASNDGYGIQIGKSDRVVLPTDTGLDQWNNASILHSAHTIISSPNISNNISSFTLSRTFTNKYHEDKDFLEIGLMTKETNTASAKNLLIRDTLLQTLPDSASFSILYSIEAPHDSAEGGLLLNAIKFIYNVIFNGSVTASSMVKNNGTNFADTYATGADATTASYFAVASSITDNFGIVVGYDEKTISPNSTNMPMITSNITKGTTDIGDIAINGSDTYFTISREFTNTGTSNITLNRIGILTKSLIYLAINNTGSNIVLQPNQKLRVTYTLSTTC